MELYQLRTFAAVAELGSLTQAAEWLHLSPPAASAQIKMLEEELGVTLFERKQSGLTLTHAGKLLHPTIEQLLDSARLITARAKDLSGQVTGQIKFAFVTILDESLLRLKQMVDRISDRHPLLELELRHLNSRAIIAGVLKGDLDVGIVLTNKQIPKIRRLPLKRLYYRIVAPPKWGHMRRASWRELASTPWICAPKDGSLRQMIMQLFKRLPCQSDSFVLADSEEMATRLVTMGVGMGLMRENVAIDMDRNGEVVLVDKGRPHTYVQFIYRAGREGESAIQAIAGVVAEVWPDARLLCQNGTGKSA